MNQEKLVVLTLFMLLLLPLAFSAEPMEVTNPLPTFVIQYDESSAPVRVDSVQLRDLFQNVYQLSGPIVNSPTNPHIFNYTSTRYLTNKDYIFTINANDTQGNPREDTIHIIVNVDYMPIYVTSPLSPLFSEGNSQDFAVGTTLPFTLHLRTADDVICRIKTSSLGGQEPLLEWNSAATTFNDGDLTPSKDHELTVVADAQGDNTVLQGRALNYNNLFLNSYLVVCKQEAEPEPVYHLKEIYVGYDTTPPSQTISFSPTFMENFADVSTVMTVSTNEDLIMCEYALQPPIQLYPPSILPSPLTSFTDLFRTKNKTFDFNDYKELELSFNTPYTYTLVTNCTNPAGLWSEASASFTIELSTLLRMTLAETHFSVAKPTLTLTTNLASTCWYEEDDLVYATSSNNLEHTFTSKTFSEGNNPFEIHCLSEQGNLESKTFTIVIDSKAPLAPIIKSGKDLCEPRFELHLGAPDPRDTVAYNISLYTGSSTTADNRIAGPEQTSFTDRDVLFTTGNRPTPTINQSYTWEVFAIDRAGNKGTSVKHTITSVPFDSLTCDVTPPQMRAKAEKLSSGYEVNISCSDAESGCADNFRLLTIALNETCNFDQGVSTPYTANPLLYEEDTQLCYVGSDNAGNEKTGKLVLELDNLQLIEQLCENGFKDTDEEGIDCGGVCPDECPEEELDEYELGQEDDDQDDAQDDANLDDDDDSVISCLDDFDCPLGELCMQGICKPDSSQSAKDSFLPWLLIILGILFILGGVGYIVYAEKQKQEYAKQKARYQQSSQETAAMAAKRLADEKKYLEELKKKRLAGEQKRSKLSEEKKSERSKLLDAFAAEESESGETEKETTPSSLTDESLTSSVSKETASKEETSSLPKSTSQEPSKLDEGLTDEFVLLDDLGKPKKDGSTDSPSSKDVFSDLQKLNKKTKDIKKDKSTQEDADETSTN